MGTYMLGRRFRVALPERKGSFPYRCGQGVDIQTGKAVMAYQEMEENAAFRETVLETLRFYQALSGECPVFLKVHWIQKSKDKTLWIVTEQLWDTSLHKLLRQSGGRFRWKTAVDMLLPVLDAAEIARRKGAALLQIDPDHIYLENGKIRFAQHMRRGLDRIGKHTVVVEMFQPPETLLSSYKCRPSADVYMAAATLYMLILGKRPPDPLWRYRGNGLDEQLRKLVPTKLYDVIVKGLEIIEEERIQTAGEFATALRSL